MKRLAVAIACLSAALSAHAQCGLIISEYIEGLSNNKAIELYNGTGSSIDLAAGNYVLQEYVNGASSPNASVLSLTGTVAAGATYVIANNAATTTVTSVAQQLAANSIPMNFNGNDALVLRQGGAAGTIIDSLGQASGTDPGATGWGTDPANTTDNTLRRKASITTGDTNIADTFNPATEWDGYVVNTFDGLGSHTMNCGATNTPPAIAAIGNKTATNGAALVFAVVATDATDNDVITLSAANLPAGAVFDAVTNATAVTNTFNWNPVGAVGVYTTSFFAADNDGTTTQAVTITVVAAPATNQPPVMSAISPKSVLVGSNLTFTVTATDLIDNDAITLSASNLPAGATFDTITNLTVATNSFVWNSATPAGVYTVQFYAVDNDGVTSQTATISVQNPAVEIGTSNVWINEFMYDPPGTDTNEFIELCGVAGTDLSGLSVVLYNGSGGASYYTTNLTGVLTNESCGYGTYLITFGTDGMQNGAPDGLALVQGSTVLQFLSYEGTMTASTGPAAGLTTTNSLGTLTQTNLSLQLAGTATNYNGYLWVTNAPTPGALNAGQYITGCSGPGLTVQFSPASATVGEAAGTYDVLVYKSAADSNVTAELVLGGTATQGVDYTVSTTNISLAGATTGQTVTITLLNDAVAESNETLVLTLTNVQQAANGAASTFTLTITDDDVLALAITTAVQAVQNDVTTIDIAGTAAAVVGELVWSNLLTGATGTTPAGATWSASALPLGVGLNTISVIGTNASGGSVQATRGFTRLDLPRTGTNLILVQDFEATDTWAIAQGAAFVSTATGAADFPDSQRVFNGAQSWQVINASGTLELASAAIGGYTGRQVNVRLSSTAITSGQGADGSDHVRVFVALDGAAFAASPELDLTGNSNARWGFWATNRAAIAAGSVAAVAAPQANQSTNNYSDLFVLIPDAATSVAVRVIANNDSTNEIWNVDAVRVTGFSGAPAPALFFFTNAATVAEDVGLVSVTVYKSSTNASLTGQIRLTGTATRGSDYTVSTTNLTLNGATTSQTVTVTVLDDGSIEPAETIILSLVNVVGGGTNAPGVMTLTINDNDADPDGDGMPDAWETDNFGTTTNGAAGDVDADGYSNLDEYIAGTQPANSNSFLKVTGVASGPGTQVSFFGATGRVYRLDFSDDLLNPAGWSEFTNSIPGTNGLMWVPQGATNSSRGYRVRVQLP